MSDLGLNLLRPVGFKSLVTGATGDFGKSIIKALHEDGHQVIAIGRNPEKLKSVKELCTKIISMDMNDTVTLKNEGWDNKWVYHSHVFKKDKIIYAIGYTKVAFWKKNKVQKSFMSNFEYIKLNYVFEELLRVDIK